MVCVMITAQKTQLQGLHNAYAFRHHAPVHPQTANGFDCPPQQV